MTVSPTAIVAAEVPERKLGREERVELGEQRLDQAAFNSGNPR